MSITVSFVSFVMVEGASSRSQVYSTVTNMAIESRPTWMVIRTISTVTRHTSTYRERLGLRGSQWTRPLRYEHAAYDDNVLSAP